MLTITKLNNSFLLILLISISLFTGCGDDDDPITPPNEEELITTLNIVFTPEGGGTPVAMKYFDEDGADGPAIPTAVGGVLEANTSYTVAIGVLNESETPVEDITSEILLEADEHQFFFSKTSVLDLSFTYADMDNNGRPVGLSTVFVTGAASIGKLTVILRHEPNKEATGVSTGDITNAGGETDIETTPAFDISIQ